MNALCFGTETARKRVLETLGLTPMHDRPMWTTTGCLLQPWRTGTGAVVWETLGDEVALAALAGECAQVLAVGMRHIHTLPGHVRQATCPGVFEEALNTGPLTPEQTEQLRQAIADSSQQPPPPRRSRRQQEAPRWILYSPVHIHVEQQPPQRPWADVLRERGDPLRDGQPECITCRECRASVCFTPCNHQIMCDGCVARLQTPVTCPMCRAPVQGLARPIVNT
jgi:Zinc finger, C3HC4 type (RING finger)